MQSRQIDRPAGCECDFDSGEPCLCCRELLEAELPVVGIAYTVSELKRHWSKPVGIPYLRSVRVLRVMLVHDESDIEHFHYPED